MNFLKRARAGESTEIALPLTSLIDCVFLLLIYFLVTSRLTLPEGQLASALGSDRRGASSSSLQPQVLRVTREGGATVYALGDRRLLTQQSLTNVLTQLPKDNGLFVRVPGDVRVEDVAAALQAARDAGFTRISYVPTGQ
jgi:biopolymer transport protein ExbD